MKLETWIMRAVAIGLYGAPTRAGRLVNGDVTVVSALPDNKNNASPDRKQT